VSELCTCYKNGRSKAYDILALFEKYDLLGDYRIYSEWRENVMFCLSEARRKKKIYLEDRLRDITCEERDHMKIVSTLREEKKSIKKEIEELEKV